ncbi:acetyltransferase, partial [Salmonella enterica subsp. enterica serovar Typhimurium]
MRKFHDSFCIRIDVSKKGVKMMIIIRRSRHEEGEKLIASWRRAVDATHDFLSIAYRAELEE